MTDVTPTGATDSCGCCRPPAKTADDVLNDLLARREAVDERLRRLELAGAAR